MAASHVVTSHAESPPELQAGGLFFLPLQCHGSLEVPFDIAPAEDGRGTNASYPGIVALTVSLIGPGSPLVFTHRPMMCTVLPPSAPSNVNRCGVRVSVAW